MAHFSNPIIFCAMRQAFNDNACKECLQVLLPCKASLQCMHLTCPKLFNTQIYHTHFVNPYYDNIQTRFLSHEEAK